MKLVQLLAKELKEWPDVDECSDPICFITQDASGVIFSWNDNGELKFVDGQWYMQGTIPFDEVIFDGSETCSDCSSAIVREEQWQDEREKMNKPKWIRHRGGKCPVAGGTEVETRHRDGKTYSPHFHTKNSRSGVAMNAVWEHKGDALDIMAYRVVEETKDQEIEEVRKFSKDVDMNIGKGEIIHGPVSIGDTVITAAHPKLDTNLGALTYKLEIDATEATQQIDSLVSKWGQIESPLKWRDAIIHCQAIIEDCEREIQRNVNLLDAEGLMMQKDSKKAMQHYQNDIDMSDWRNWENGDIIEVIKESETSNAKAGLYTITGFDSDHPKIELDERYFPEYANMKFVRRP